MYNNVIIRAVVDVPPAAAKLKKYTLKGATRWSFIQFAPESGNICACNGSQLQFIPVQFEAVERGEKYKLANCAVGACSPKDIKAIAGRRVEIVVTAEKCTTMYYTTGGRNVATSTDYRLTKFYSDNGKLLCSCSTPLGDIIPPVTSIYSPDSLNTSACINVDKKAAKTLAGLLKLCALDKVGSKQFAAVSVEFAAGESVAIVRSYLFGDSAADPVFTIKEHRLKLTAPAVVGGLYYVQASYLIDALSNDLTLHFVNVGKECKIITQSDNGTQIAMGCNSAAEKAQARAEAVSKDLAEGEKMESEAQSAEAAESAAVDNHTQAESNTQAAAVVVDSVPTPAPTTAKNAPPEVLNLRRKIVVYFGRSVIRRPRRGDTSAKWSKPPAVVDNDKPP